MIKKYLPYLALATSVVLFSATYFRNQSQPSESLRENVQTAKAEPVAKGEFQSEPAVGSPAGTEMQSAQAPAPQRVEEFPVAPSYSTGRVLASRPAQQPVHRDPVNRERRSVYSAPAASRAPESAAPVHSSGNPVEPSNAGVTAAQPEQVPDYPATAAPSTPDYPRESRRTRTEVYTSQPDSVPPPAPRQERVVIPAGTEFNIRTLDRISSEDSRSGERFAAAVESDIHADGRLVIPARSEVTGRLVTVTPAGRVSGRSEMVLELESVIINGESYNLRTSKLTQRGESSAKEDATKVAAGAAIGAVLGAITGGKRGAVVGATMGGGAGTAQVMMARGKPVRIGPETQLHFRLEAPLEVTVR